MAQVIDMAYVTVFTCPHCRSNVNINDVLGDYSLTLVDTLDTLAVRTFVRGICTARDEG